jgi:hypothetical protein
MKQIFWVLLVLAASWCGALAEEAVPVSPVMLSLFTPVQVPSSDYDVAGLRINLLYGQCQNLYGVDVGLVNHATGREIGLAVGLVNISEKGFTGLEVGLVNVAERVAALQIGIYNGGDDVSGLQIGLINHARIMRGVQIGAVNVIENNDLPFLPIINFFF